MVALFLYKNTEGQIMEVKIITGTAEEIAKVLQAIEDCKEQSISINQFAKAYESQIKQDINLSFAD
ncbi:hypothetical protein D922_02852 [Enterococcus faecalis 06-MB-DW-09]|nr:hypothetical protein D922_02852 [Enterococcus faecalis 06-MB-DW-09]